MANEDQPDTPHTPTRLEEFGAQLQALREKRGMSRETLAHKLDRTESWLAQLEEGKGGASLVKMQAAVSALGGDLRVTVVEKDRPAGTDLDGVLRRVEALELALRMDAHLPRLDLYERILDRLASRVEALESGRAT